MAEILRKGGLAVSMPLKELKGGSVKDRVETFLRKGADRAWTTNGVLIERFGVDPANLRGQWTNWDREIISAYNRVRRALETLHVEGKVGKEKRGNKLFWFWKGG